MKKLIVFFLACFLLVACGKKGSQVAPEDLNEFGIDVTFVGEGRTVHFKQFNPENSNEGLLGATCFFRGEQMLVSFSASNYMNPGLSNGYLGGFSIASVTSARVYQFAMVNAAATNTAEFLKRIAPGTSGKPSPLLTYNNFKNYSRFRNGSGGCDEIAMPIDFQSIDVTRYSSEIGGVIEGDFDIRVYNKPDDDCLSYQKKIITGTFKLKRVNI